MRIVEGGNRIESIKVWWKNMDFNETILDLNNGSTTSYVPWTGFLNMLNFVAPLPHTYIIRIINICLIKIFGKLIFTRSSH